MLFATSNGKDRVMAEPGGRARCPGCNAQMIAKCGEHVIWHWAHAAEQSECDPWTEGESDWHREWKLKALDAGCRVEVTIKDRGQWHRADIVRPDGVVVEVQRSYLDALSISARELFYYKHGGLLWLWDARERWWGSIYHREQDAAERWYSKKFSPALVQVTQPMIWEISDEAWEETWEQEGPSWTDEHFNAHSNLVWIRKSWVGDWRIQIDLRPALEREVFAIPEAVQAADAWRFQPLRCATCGAKPTGIFHDGSPRYECYDPLTHRPVAASLAVRNG